MFEFYVELCSYHWFAQQSSVIFAYMLRPRIQICTSEMKRLVVLDSPAGDCIKCVISSTVIVDRGFHLKQSLQPTHFIAFFISSYLVSMHSCTFMTRSNSLSFYLFIFFDFSTVSASLLLRKPLFHYFSTIFNSSQENNRYQQVTVYQR